VGFGLSFLITAVASVIISLQFVLEPTAGHYYQLIGFLVCVIAGMGNLKGGFYAGLLVGLISTVANIYAAAWHDPIIFLLFVVILVYMPNGVFTSKKSVSRAV
jgi:branched-subunit amino acid ABC-type transport system permease component